MSETVQLACWIISGDDAPSSLKEADGASSQLLSQEAGKKSSFLLDINDTVLEQSAQTHIIVENDSAEKNIFFLGGFQIISNAKQSEVFLTGNDGKEKYLTTSRGIPFEKESGESWFKAVCVIPGGPRSVTRLRLKLFSIQPADTTTTRVRFLKLTARIPDKKTPPPNASPARTQLGAMPLPTLSGSGSAFTPAHPAAFSSMFQAQHGSTFMPTPTNPNFGGMPTVPNHPSFNAMSPSGPNHPNFQPPPSAPQITQDDLGAAMAGISMMTRSNQEDMEESMKKHVSKLQENLDVRWTKLEGYISTLTTVVVSQKTVLDEKSKIMMQQHEMISEQSLQISALIKQQVDLVSTVKSLQSDVSGLRQQVTETSQLTGQQQQQQLQQPQEIAAIVKSMQADQQQELSSAIKFLQSDVSELCQYAKENVQQNELSATLLSLQADVSDLRKSIQETPKDQETNQKQQALYSTLAVLTADVDEIRRSVKENTEDDKNQDLSSTVNSLQWDLSELRRSVQENAEELRRRGTGQVPNEERGEIVLNGSQDFPDDFFAVRSLEAVDAPSMEEAPSLEGTKEIDVFQLFKRPTKPSNTSNENTVGENVRGTMQKLNNIGPPPFKPSPPQNKSAPANEFREITNDKDMKPAGSNDSCPGLETIEVSLIIDDGADIPRENNSSAAKKDSGAAETTPKKADKQSMQQKQDRQVAFKEVGLEDRFEYERPSSLSASHDSSDIMSRKAPEDSSTEDGERAGENKNVFERGLQLFKYYSEL
jgi:NTP pyrophosphatase (non-canonical NTP hydrolase)